MSKGVKFCHYLLTSPELGYTKVEVEYFLEKSKATDIYIHDVDLCIEIDGPPHYFSNTGERKLGLQDRITEKLSNPLRIHYLLFDGFLGPKVDFTTYEEPDFADVK